MGVSCNIKVVLRNENKTTEAIPERKKETA
jgi:hypothetical protein